MDILGDIVQANRYSLNPQYFGANSANGLHGNGHIVISMQSDPQFQSRVKDLEDLMLNHTRKACNAKV